MGNQDLDAPELFFNRELSWLEFNERVLREGQSPAVPLLERLKFLAIVSSNLEEFFMIRVAGLMQQRAAGIRRHDVSGLTAAQQLSAISERVHRMGQAQGAAIREVLGQLAGKGLNLLAPEAWTIKQRQFLQAYFVSELQPVLTLLAVEELSPCPMLPGQELNVALRVVAGRGAKRVERILVVPVPRQFPRFVSLPGEGAVYLARLEDVIVANAGLLVPEYEVLGRTVFRITRDGDVAIQGDEASDLLEAVEAAVIERRRRAAVRLTVSAEGDPQLAEWLRNWLGLRPEETYQAEAMIDAAALMELVYRRGFDDLRESDWPPQMPRDLVGAADLWETIQHHDCLLFHPYESFEPVVRLIQEAAEDSNVLAIKQTLYRTSGDSPIIKALALAAQKGKQVTVLVELKARFDEARNVTWARSLEDAGCHVIYGIAEYKTHAKALLIVRREAQGIRRYVHLSTGNYNDRTALLYSDLGLMTCDHGLAADVAAFFNLLTGYSEALTWARLSIAPTELRRRFVELIDREIEVTTADQPGLIMAKVNSLEDRDICQALYRASRAGVRVRLNVRGLCCLRPGIPGVSENIEVRSIVDRYLEHARIFHFANGGHDEVYLSSADWMERNLDKRLEVLFPLVSPQVKTRVIGMLQTFWADNLKAWRLLPDGTYEPVKSPGEHVRAQERFYNEAVAAARLSTAQAQRFHPLKKAKE